MLCLFLIFNFINQDYWLSDGYAGKCPLKLFALFCVSDLQLVAFERSLDGIDPVVNYVAF